MQTNNTDVIVVGAGPAGLTAAGDLARLGRSVTVLERWPQINPASRAFATMASTLEVLDSRGLADELLQLGNTTPAVNLFAGAKIDLSHLHSRYPYGLITPQTNVDQTLDRYARKQGATLLRGLELVAMDQDADGVTAVARPKDDDDPGHRQEFRARFLVAADGAHSTVRDLLGRDFPGKAVLSSVVLADVKLTAGPTDPGLTLGSTPDCFGFLVPYGRHDTDGSWFRSMTWDRDHQVPDTAPVGEAEVGTILNRSMRRDVGLAEVSWKSRFHCDERQIRRYRAGRVFFTGDAAHVHSPMGGQGMNTGIQDSANLAWKLDAVLGGADDAVLRTYHDERYPIGRRVVMQSGLMMRGVTLHPAPARWMRDRLAPPLLAIPWVRDLVSGSFAGTELRYGHRRDEGAAVGTRAMTVPLVEGRLGELQRDPGFVLIRQPGRPAFTGPGTDRVQQAERTNAGPALLVRPDGYVAWSADSPGPDDSSGPDGKAGWRSALQWWTVPGGTRTV